MNIRNVIKLIPEESYNEALLAIESVTLYPPRKAIIRCHLSSKFRISIKSRLEKITLSAENFREKQCTPDSFLTTLKIIIYDIDEAIFNGSYKQEAPKSNYIIMLPPPSDMDIPVWDEKIQSWYDAEY